MKEQIKIIQSTVLSEDAKKQVFDLWNSEYSFICLNDLDHYLQNLYNLHHFLLIDNYDKISGWAFSFDRDNERWFAIILSEAIQGKGFGRKMLDEIKKTMTCLNGWVIDHNIDKKKNGLPYISPLKFYEKYGFEVLSEIRLELDNISAVKIKWMIGKQ